MSAFKQFLTQDIIVEPFKVNKGFSFLSSEFNNDDVLIARYLGQNLQSTPFISGSNTPTGNSSVGTQDPELIYNSTKELYYSNFLTSSYGSPVQTQSLRYRDQIKKTKKAGQFQDKANRVCSILPILLNAFRK